jgi:hypothetical protein
VVEGRADTTWGLRRMSGLMPFPTRLLVVAATIGSLTALSLALAPAAFASSVSGFSPRSGNLHVTKECSQYTRLADSFCTITSSNLEAIAKGSRVVYLQAAGATALDSDIALVVGPGNYALGRVHLPFPAGPGTVTFSGGIGSFTRFHASVVVTRDLSAFRGWFWNGTYSFGSRDDAALPSSQSREDRSESGALHVTKECSQFTGLADTFCTITASSLGAIKAGSRVVYLQAANPDTSLDSDVILVVGPGNFAQGHCTVSALNVGRCRFFGGIGSFAGFHARVNVSSNDPAGIVVNWDGTYRFGRDD